MEKNTAQEHIDEFHAVCDEIGIAWKKYEEQKKAEQGEAEQKETTQNLIEKISTALGKFVSLMNALPDSPGKEELEKKMRQSAFLSKALSLAPLSKTKPTEQ